MRYGSAFALLLPLAVQAAVPLSKQHPLIARVDQPYSWTVSPLTFDNSDTTSILVRDAPDWLTYDNTTSTFRGRPTAENMGMTTVRVRNSAGTNDHFPLWVTDLPSPTVGIPLSSQLVPGNPWISSGFTFSSPDIGVRVPPKWSFSIGYDGNTFTTPDGRNIFYDATLENGLPLPSWVVFNNRTLTFDGVAPPENHATTLSIILYGSDRWGFGAIHQQFDLVVGPRTHLLGIDGVGGLETVNVTGAIQFEHSVKTFGGLVIDGIPVVSANVSQVEVDVSSIPWLRFDKTTRNLVGTPPISAIGQLPYVLPVRITSDYNDTVATNLSIAVFPSYFITAPILPLVVAPGALVNRPIQDYFSHARSAQATIAAQFVPHVASSWLTYNDANNTLIGTVPQSATYNEVNVTLIATDSETHAVSTVYVAFSISNATFRPEVWDRSPGTDHSAQAKTAVIITFSVIGGTVLLCCLLALCRHYCGVRDLEEDDESSAGWKGQDLVSYAQRVISSEKMMRGGRSSQQSDGTDETLHSDGKSPGSLIAPPTPGLPDAPPKAKTMKKVHFFQRLMTPPKRKVWGQGLGSQSSNIRRSQIGYPTPIDADTLAQLPMTRANSGSHVEKSETTTSHEQRGHSVIGVVNTAPDFTQPEAGPVVRGLEVLPLESGTQVTLDLSSQTPSVSDGSSLTSIPRRRSDFLPPRDQRTVVGNGDGAGGFAVSYSSGTLHLDREPAVISTAARQVVPSTISTSSVSRTATRSSVRSSITNSNKHQSLPGSPGSVSVTGVRRPRIVQLNSEHRVPSQEGASTVRNKSQKATVTGPVKQNNTGGTDPDHRLSLGLHFVPGLDGDDAVFYLSPPANKTPSPLVGDPTPGSNIGSSETRSSSKTALDSRRARRASHRYQKQVQIGVPFAISIPFEVIPARGTELVVRQQDGQPAPGWVHFDRRDVELWGVPMKEHEGTHLLEIIESSATSQRVVSRICLEVERVE